MVIGGVLESFLSHDKTRNEVCSFGETPVVSNKDSTSSNDERGRNRIPVSIDGVFEDEEFFSFFLLALSRG